MIGKAFGSIKSAWEWFNADVQGVDQAIVDENHKKIKAYSAQSNKYLREHLQKRLIEKAQIEREIPVLYQVLSKKIEDAMMLTHQNGKPLLILIAEDYVAVNSAIVEAMILRIAAEHGFKEVFTEAFNTELFDEAIAFDSFWANGTVVLPSQTTEVIAKEIGLKKIPMDYALYEELIGLECINLIPKYEANPIYKNTQLSRALCSLSDKEMQKRAEVMADVIMKSKNNKIAVIGLDNMDGFLKNKMLNDNHNILLINACDLECDNFRKPHNIYHAQVETINKPGSVYKLAPLITPQMIAEKSRNIHEHMRLINYELKPSMPAVEEKRDAAPQQSVLNQLALHQHQAAKCGPRECVNFVAQKAINVVKDFRDMDTAGKGMTLTVCGLSAWGMVQEDTSVPRAIGYAAIAAIGFAKMRNPNPRRQ